ncbi:hypothetical protein BH23PSE1_BH23PSE1_14290 [soil metagenome]
MVLTAGSMRMAVEASEDARVHCLWCHEGRIGRDTFPPALLKKWEVRETDARPPREEGGFRRSRDDEGGFRRPRDDDGGFRRGRDDDGGPRRGAKPYGGPASPAAHKPRPKTGWDGKPREKKFFRKD